MHLFLRQNAVVQELVRLVRDRRSDCAGLEQQLRAVEQEAGHAGVEVPSRRDAWQSTLLQTRVDDAGMQMDAVLGKLADTRREFETLSGTVSSVQTMSMSLATEMQRVKLDVRDAHDAIVTHENEIRDLTAKLETGVETAMRVSQRYESEMVPLLAQRKTTTQELQDVRISAAKDREALETSIKAVREQLGNTDRMVTDTQAALHQGLERQKSVFDGRVKEVQQAMAQSLRDVQTTLQAKMEQQGTTLSAETRNLRQEVKTAQTAYE